MDKIKLVIWDLDDTFWRGTISEGEINIVEENIKLVKELTDRGIINSIVSKNDFTKVQKILVELGVWDYFVFPAIDWLPKGQLIKNIIENCQLRAPNVLFIDDNHLNLEEAKYYNPQLNTESPNFINYIANHSSFIGKADPTHTRLNQYKLLEKKYDDKKKYFSNTEFVRSSNIQVEIINNLGDNIDRIYELLDRTNQLNYTKKRLNVSEIELLLKDENVISALIRVKDKYGDYGIVGFYSLDKIQNQLIHFVFSCRIINLGIPQYFYSKLNYPALEIIPEVAENLDDSLPDWISEINPNSVNNSIIKSKNKLKVFFKGGCDLGQMLYYLNGFAFDIIEETNYVSKTNMPIHNEHTQILIDSIELSRENKDYAISNIPFIDKDFYKTKLFNSDYDVLVYSVLMDYTQEIYLHREKNIYMPYGGYYNYLTNKDNHEKILEDFHNQSIRGIGNYELNWFADHFKHIGQISPEKFINNLGIIRNYLPESVPIIFINGAEIKSPNSLELFACERHRQMNIALESFINENINCYLLDVRKIAGTEENVTNNIRHYTRQTYKAISDELVNILEDISNSTINKQTWLKKIIKNNTIYYYKIKRKINSLTFQK